MSRGSAIASGIAAAEEQAEILAVTSEFARGELIPRALKIDVNDETALAESWAGVCEIGLQRCALPEEAGGIGLGFGGLVALVEELAVGDGGVATLVLLNNAALSFLPVEDVKELDATARYSLIQLPRPDMPGGGALSISAKTATGRVAFALGARGAAGLVLAGRRDGEPVVVAVEEGAKGLVTNEFADQLGLIGAPAGALELSRTPVKQLGGAQAALEARILLHAGIAAVARGIARRANELALDYAENRYQGGSMIIDYGAVRDMIARIAERNRATAAATVFTGFSFNGGGPRSGNETLAQAIAAKTAATDAAVASTLDAVQVFGGMGYMHETGVEKLMRDAKYCQMFPQSNWLTRDELVELERGNEP